MDLDELNREVEALRPKVEAAHRKALAANRRYQDLAGRQLRLGVAIEQERYRRGLPQVAPDGRVVAPHPHSAEERRRSSVADEAAKHLPPNVIPDAKAMADARERLDAKGAE